MCNRTGSCCAPWPCCNFGGRHCPAYGEETGGEAWNSFAVHYTPKHGSWLNRAEIEIGMFARRCLGNRENTRPDEARGDARAWKTNRERVKINWKFDRKAARRKFGYKKLSFRRSEN